jgi:hypothetical protein
MLAPLLPAESTLGHRFSYLLVAQPPLGPSSAYQNYGPPPSVFASYGAPSYGQLPVPLAASLGVSPTGMFSGGASTSSLAPPARVPTPLSSSSAVQFTYLLPIKLGHDNYLFWKAQITPLLRSNGLLCFVHVPIATEGGMVLVQNPDHGAWIQQDQAILSAIVSSLTPLFLVWFFLPLRHMKRGRF